MSATPDRVDVSVLGELNPDIILSHVRGQPAPGQERVVEDALITIGSSSAIFATIAARLGLRVRIVGKVGDDWFGRYVVEALKREGIDTSAVLVDPAVKTGVTVAITGSGDRMLITFPGAMAALRAQEVETEALYTARHLHVGSYYLQEGLRPGLPALLQGAVERGLTTSLDPGHDPYGRWDGLEDLLGWVDLFLPNEEEAMEIAGRLERGSREVPRTVRDVAAALARRVRRLVAVKRGESGALLATADGRLLEGPAHPVSAIDTTGAGDAFDAGFVYKFLEGHPPERCLEFANACGAVAVTYLGGTPGFPGPDEIQARLRRHGGSRCQA